MIMIIPCVKECWWEKNLMDLAVVTSADKEKRNNFGWK